uniref:TIL domain-containing protein n=1 Tax=Panagrellus redivivus TaxID=6233 RepID=A0A7E4ZXY3_PANRE
MRTVYCIAILMLNVIMIRADRSQLDCQENEVFIQCGRCEGTCKTPVVEKCDPNCRLPRCECQVSEGFVRAHDGACIKADECATYVGIEIYGDGNYKMLREPKPSDAPAPPAPPAASGSSEFGAAPPAYGPEISGDVDSTQNNEYDENTVNSFADVGADYGGVHQDDPNGAQPPAYPPARDEPYLSAYIYGPPQYQHRRLISAVKAL